MAKRPCYCDRTWVGVPHTPEQCLPCWKLHNEFQYRQLWNGGKEYGPPIPCQHRGLPTAEMRQCSNCQKGPKTAVLRCGLKGKCTLTPTLDDTLPVCLDCRDRVDPRGDKPAGLEEYVWVAPLGTKGASGLPINGRGKKKPWTFPVSIIIPHLETPDLLEFVLPLWRHQTVEPYFIIVDTGSPWETCERLEKLRSEDCEIHYLRVNGHWHTSGPICHALDLGFSRCLTPFLFSTHVDVFPNRRDFLAWLMGQCHAAQPVLGWQMSPRASDPREDWKRCVSHTATIFHMPTVRQHRLSYNVSAYYDWYPFPPGVHNGWPDTESFLQLSLDRAGIKPKLLGSEENFELTSNEWFDHARSYTLTRHLWTPGQNKVIGYANQALEAARQRLEQWDAGTNRAVSSNWPTLSVIVPIRNRSSLWETFDSLLDLTYDDEVLVAGNGPQPQAQALVESLLCPFHWVDAGGPYDDFGGEVRNRLMEKAAGGWLLFLDEDAAWVSGALTKIRSILAQAPRLPHFFKSELDHQNRTVWEEPVLRPGNLVPQMMVVPNDKSKLGHWSGMEHDGLLFARSTCALYDQPPVWREEVISRVHSPQIQAVPVT